MSYYQYFSLPTTGSRNPFTIDTRDLRRRFLQTQRLCHPDIWAQKGQKALALAEAQSSQLNKAYQTLLSPLDRAHYILSLHGVEESETEKLEDEDFIMQVMEARQEVEEASTTDELNRIKEINKERIDATVSEIESLIGEKDWEQVRQAAVRLKYWLGIENASKESAHS